MHLVQILLPLSGGDGARLPQALFDTVRTELVQRFGGLTAYTRSPARGLWVDEAQDKVERDDIVIYEVLVPRLERPWWRTYRATLAHRFAQKELLVRAQPVELL